MRNAPGFAAAAALALLLACQQPPPPTVHPTGPGDATGNAPAPRPRTVDPPPPAAAPAAKPAEPLLLLDEETPAGPGAPGADNRRCHVCHLNYIDEPMAVAHARVDVGCAKCHGPSDAHIADESWASGGNGTAPDIMYPPDKINPGCIACHPREKLSPKDHRDFFLGKIPQKLCTDCHAEMHRLLERTCKWK